MTADRSNMPSPEHPAPDHSAPERKLIRIKGVQAIPGGPVRFQELRDGWATFTDFGAMGRRWQYRIIVSIFVLLGILVFHQRVIGPSQLDFVFMAGLVALVLLLRTTQLMTDGRSSSARRRLRRESALRAGGTGMLRQAINKHGPARTVGQMNILISSLGRTDPVFSLKRVRHAQVRREWWRTTVTLELTNGKELTYRVVGVRAPHKLAAAFAADRLPD